MISVLVAGIALYGCGLFFAGLLLGRASTRSLAELLRLGGAEHTSVLTSAALWSLSSTYNTHK